MIVQDAEIRAPAERPIAAADQSDLVNGRLLAPLRSSRSDLDAALDRRNSSQFKSPSGVRAQPCGAVPVSIASKFESWVACGRGRVSAGIGRSRRSDRAP